MQAAHLVPGGVTRKYARVQGEYVRAEYRVVDMPYGDEQEYQEGLVRMHGLRQRYRLAGQVFCDGYRKP